MVAEDGLQALSSSQTDTPNGIDLLISDIQMPGPTGNRSEERA
jgi:hypothetical protein